MHTYTHAYIHAYIHTFIKELYFCKKFEISTQRKVVLTTIFFLYVTDSFLTNQ